MKKGLLIVCSLLVAAGLHAEMLTSLNPMQYMFQAMRIICLKG